MAPDSHAPIHDRIQAFLEARAPISLIPAADEGRKAACRKAGIVPFIRAGGGYRYCVMKPVPRHKELGGPAMQLCKGTRMHWRDGQGWCDIREKSTKEARMESLAATAVREGREELGLTLEAIHRLFELGFYDFASARTGHRKEMYMFAAEVSDPGLLLPMENIRATTAERGWLTLAQFEVVGRDDHRYILRDIEARLKAHFRE